MLTTGDIVIRGLRDEDFAAVAAVWTAAHPDAPVTPEEVRQDAERLDRSRFVAEWLLAAERGSDRVVGYAYYRHVPWAHHPGKYRLTLVVHPEAEGRGIGRRLMDEALRALRARGAERVKASAREDRLRAIAFLQRSGFVEHARDFESRLPVAGCDLSRFADAAARSTRYGVVLTTLADEIARDATAPRVVYQLAVSLDLAAPRTDPDPPTPHPYERWLAREVHHRAALPDAFFLAKVEDLYVGLSHLKRSAADPGLLLQQLTAVLHEYRGLGIATALKLRTVVYAREHGYREIRTWNSSLNASMLAINAKLGFVHQPAWVEFMRYVGGAAADAVSAG